MAIYFEPKRRGIQYEEILNQVIGGPLNTGNGDKLPPNPNNCPSNIPIISQRPISYQFSPSDSTWFMFQVFDALIQKNYTPEEAIKIAKDVTNKAFEIKVT